MNKFSSVKYSLAEEALADLRQRSVALRNAVALVKGGNVTWEPERAASEVSKVETSAGSMIIKQLRDYLSRCCIGGVSALVKGTIGVSYMVVGDVERRPVLGENTSGITGTFEWSNLTCTLDTYAGQMSRLEPTSETNLVMRSSAKDRKKIQQATGWDTNLVNVLPPDDIHALDSLLLSASAGQSKFTRILKGMLLFLDVQRYGEQQFVADIPNIIEYNPAQVLGSYRRAGRSYCYCRNPTSQSYIVLLHLIGLSYPPVTGGLNCRGSVNVPSDSDNHYVVLRGTRANVSFNCTLSAELVWTGMLDYAKEMGCADLIEPALVLACSMFDNRYLRVGSVPKVESTLDLIRPAFVESRVDDSFKPVIDSDMGIVVGRCHQSAMHLTAKDIIIAAQMSSTTGTNYASVIRSYISAQEKEVVRMSATMTPVGLVASVPQLRWLSKLTDDDIEDMSSLSILESLWLCTSKTRSVTGGGIDLMVRARNDMLRSNEYIDLLDRECRKMMINFQRNKVPTGRYSVVGRCVFTHEDVVPKEGKFTELDMNLIQSCDYVPPKKEPVVRLRTVKSSQAVGLPRKSRAQVMAEISEEDFDESSVSGQPYYQDQTEDAQTKSEWEEDDDDDNVMGSIEGSIVKGKREEDKGDNEIGPPPLDVVENASSSYILANKLPVTKPSIGEMQVGMRPAGPSSAWSKPLAIERDTGLEDKMFSDIESNRGKIIRLPEPHGTTRRNIWRRMRIQEVRKGTLTPVLDKEKAISFKELYVGQVDLEWEPEVIRSIVGSRGLREAIEVKFGREKIFGDSKVYYYSNILAEGLADIRVVEELDKRFSGSTVNVTPNVAVNRLAHYMGVPREYVTRDSMTSTKRTVADGLLADAMWKDEEVRRSISSTQAKSLRNVFKSTPQERERI